MTTIGVMLGLTRMPERRADAARVGVISRNSVTNFQ